MQLRWLHRKFSQPTVQDIKDYSTANGVSLPTAHIALKTLDQKILQVRNPANNEWVDVPIVVEEVSPEAVQ